jgi:pyrroline-5-carboxylate reductase
METIGFIGCGNMGGAIARAVCRAADPQFVLLANRTPAKAEALAAELGCRSGTNAEAAACSLVFLGVKPQVLPGVLAELAPQLAARQDRFVLISMAAGIPLARLQALAGGAYPAVRILPNTPAAIGAGMIQYCCSAEVTPAEKERLCALLAPAGLLDELPEALSDAAGCVSGCGPAWAYQFIEALADGGVACGLPRDKAIRYAAQMMVGSAQLVLESGRHPGALKDAVCSPGGSTIQGVRVLEQRGFRGAVMDAVIAACDKTKDMGKAK